MRRIPLTVALLSLTLAGCQYDDDLSEEDYGQVELASIGGSTANGEAHYDALAAITIERPEGANRKTVRCSGVLVEARTVLTAASCLSENVEAQLDDQMAGEFLDAASVFVQFGSSVSGTTEYALDASFNEVPKTHFGVTLHRYYDYDGRGLNDIALLRLAESPGITPVKVHAEDLADAAESVVGMPLELVGYGKDDSSGDVSVFAVRSVVDPIIDTLNHSDIVAGGAEKNTCHADRGGPGFLDFGGTPEVVSVTGTVKDNELCDKVVNRQRVDRYADHFILPYITRFESPCMGAGCDACEYDGECKEDCPTRDLDCEIGVFVGETCDNDGQCEQGGHCIAATDDPLNMYCAIPCDPTNLSGCPASMTCGAANECIYEGISPGSQGAGCTTADDCRSNYCEALFCANTCDTADADACDTEGGFFCLPATGDSSVNVCRVNIETGGGGFCGVSPGASSHSTRNTFLSCLGFLFMVGILRRRRQQ